MNFLNLLPRAEICCFQSRHLFCHTLSFCLRTRLIYSLLNVKNNTNNKYLINSTTYCRQLTSIASLNALSSLITGASSDFFFEIFDAKSFLDINSSDLSFRFFMLEPSSPGFSSAPFHLINKYIYILSLINDYFIYQMVFNWVIFQCCFLGQLKFKSYLKLHVGFLTNYLSFKSHSK